jgi:hypothetical protein
MRRVITLEVAIIILSIILSMAIVLPSAFSPRQSTSITKYHQAINWETAARSVTLDLVAGQYVKGSLTYYGDTNGIWFTILDPDGNPMVSSPTDYEYEQNYVNFSFTAPINGQYYFRVPGETSYAKYIDYSYSITPPPIIGSNQLFLIGLVAAAAIILTVINIVMNGYMLRGRKS